MIERSPNFQGFLKVTRGSDIWELIDGDPQMAALLFQIGLRARYGATPSPDGIEQGEAMLGDHEKIGISRKEYRTRLNRLKSANYITTRTTSKGTIAKLVDTRLFDVVGEGKRPSDGLPEGPATGHQGATKEEGKKDKKEYRRRDSLSSDSGEVEKEGGWRWR